MWLVPLSAGGGTRILTALVALGAASLALSGDSDDLRPGERMYREGLLPSGTPMRALVKGDVAVQGTMFSCVSCHGRSGMGTLEAAVHALPISGPKLYASRLRPTRRRPLSRKPRVQQPPPEPEVLRPAYTDATLARAVREGVDPAGRTLAANMPRYQLDDADMAVLIRYLKSLSAETSPGVTDTAIRFATVVTQGVEAADSNAMLATLEAHVKGRNAEPKRQGMSAQGRPLFVDPKYAGYASPRRLDLARWELRGTSESWPRQLHALYAADPVFGLVGGLAAGEWKPIHEFCEEKAIPCLFPITQLSVVSANDWYTLYFSKGLYQEGQTAAQFLRSRPDLPADMPVVELLRDTPEGRALSSGFAEGWTERAPERKVLAPGEPITDAVLDSMAVGGKAGVALLWLGREDMAALSRLTAAPRRWRMIFVSSGLLGGEVQAVPEAARSLTYLTYPAPLPQEQARRMAPIEEWLREREVPLTRPALQSRAYFIGWMLSTALARMKDDFHRDYLLDLMDTMIDQSFAIVPYERMSFGPGQRYASKGCYIVQLGPGPRPEVRKRSEWTVR